jgi:hypothetical protein
MDRTGVKSIKATGGDTITIFSNLTSSHLTDALTHAPKEYPARTHLLNLFGFQIFTAAQTSRASPTPSEKLP